MLIKYNGPKPVKRLSYHVKDWGLREFIFDPTCEVTDAEFLRFLLHPDKLGLFSMVKEEEEVSTSNETPTEYVPAIDGEMKPVPKRKRGKK